ncbi:Tryptophan--tRNA ligase [Blattella germanica]|nr:Tryptophan--tRNA ligase [Blattella germanica]
MHLGNYFGAVKRWIDLQNAGDDVIYSIVDLHSITLPQVPEHTQLCWVLGCMTTMPRLAQISTYKEKSASLKEIPLGLYVYPVLQAADILLYRLKSLREPSKKMSKSDQDPKSRIELTDTPEAILEKCKKAVTDFTSKVTYDPVNRPGVANLLTIHSLFTGQEPEEICAQSQGLDTGK